MTKEKDEKINCSGGLDLESKHPLVYLHVNSKQVTVCPYCSKKFIIHKRNNRRYIEATEATDSN